MTSKTETTRPDPVSEPYVFTPSEYISVGLQGFWWGVLIGSPAWIWMGFLIGRAVANGQY